VALVAVLAVAAAPPSAAAPRRANRTARPALPHVILPASASAWDVAVGQAARSALGRAQGAVVAMDPRSGRVHALVNPALGLQRAFQPCSVFKIVVGIAGLSEGVITPDTVYHCRKGCSAWAGHGAVDLRRALAVSCNPYFEWVGEQLGYEKVRRYAHLLGLGEPSGINLTGETAGRVPTFVRPDAVGHLSSHAAGIETSAVQLAVLISATVNGGVIVRPQVSGPEGFSAAERWRLPAETRLDGLAAGFMAAVNEGSASAAFDAEVAVAGKTGTC
jgi:cell division protein FtsI/penicillin-binding protein 2